jgi:hypothetical protein
VARHSIHAFRSVPAMDGRDSMTAWGTPLSAERNISETGLLILLDLLRNLSLDRFHVTH